MNERAFLSWSGGKDSALAFYEAQQRSIPVDLLVTTASAATGRVAMHGVRTELVQQQAASLGLPLHLVQLPEMPSMEAYEETMHREHRQLQQQGFTDAVFGDVFLEDLKTYRESLLRVDGLECVFPLWGRNSRELTETFLSLGFRAVVVCVAARWLDKSFCGRELDASFLDDLPEGVDPCGENGEFHSFVYDGPCFAAPVRFRKGETVYRDYPSPQSGTDCFATPATRSGFYFCDLLP